MSQQNQTIQANEGNNTLTPYLSPLGAWALALGTSIGWGSLVVTSKSYLAQAGPLGSILGIVIGAVIMIIISRNYHYLINRYPDAGGAYAYAKEAFGHDYGFLTAWFLALTYAAMFWANVSSLPLFSRFFIGDIFQFGSMYEVFGYHVYLGEILLTAVFILLTAVLVAKQHKLAVRLVIGMAILLALLITVVFVATMFGYSSSGLQMKPAMVPGKNELMQVIKIACISPWAFIGFENISHASEEYSFPRKKVFRILTLAVITALVLYIFLLLISVAAYPPEYSSWLSYIRDLDNLDGIKGLPPFYVAQYYMGNTGVFLLLLALLGLVFTSLIGNLLALSRLLYAMARDNVIPDSFAKISKNKVPEKVIYLVAILSLIVPFMGRTAIGWIVDVTTIGATIIYGFVSVSAYRLARKDNDRTEVWTGMIGLIAMVLIALYLLLPNLFASGSMEAESYLLFSVWAILGFLFFRGVLNRDSGAVRRFGRSIIVWIALLALIFFTTLAWMGTASMTSADNAVENVQTYLSEEKNAAYGIEAQEEYVAEQMDIVKASNRWHMAVVLGIFALSLWMLLSNYALINRRIEESEAALLQAEQRANIDPLTGVKSKHAYVEMERNMNQLLKMGEEFRFAVAVCDVNGLKHVNDTQGHKAGDAYICSAAALLCDIFQHSPVFRTGGDEFVVILTGRDYDDREFLLRRLHDRSAENIEAGEVVVAGGLSSFDLANDTGVNDVFERADALMYEEKALLKSMGSISR